METKIEVSFEGKVNTVGVLRGIFTVPVALTGWLKPADIRQLQVSDSQAYWEPNALGPAPWDSKNCEVVFDASTLEKAQGTKAALLKLFQEAALLYQEQEQKDQELRTRVGDLRDVWEQTEIIDIKVVADEIWRIS